MNAKDIIQQQDNKQMEQQIAVAEAAHEHVAECAVAYAADGSDANYEALQRASDAYDQALKICAWDIIAFWRAGYRLRR